VNGFVNASPRGSSLTSGFACDQQSAEDQVSECVGHLAVGLHEGDLDEDRYLPAAQLCIEAGADTRLIPHWIDIGRQRACDIAAKHRADAPGR
jgi:hypothetical protein